MKQYLLIDIGGTFIKYSLADEQARKISGGKVPTPLTNMDDLLAAIEGFAAPLQGQFVGCAISMPGRIDTRNGIAHTGGMLSAFMWEQPFAAQVEARLGVPVTIANDGKCAAAAEGWTGALAGVENGLVLVLGTGGTHNTTSAVARDKGAARILTVSRKPDPAKGELSYEEAVHSGAQIVINTTPAGMYPNVGTCNLDIAAMPGLEAVLDVVYNPEKTEIILRAEEAGVPVAASGLEMLVAQAVYAAEYFLDRKFEDAPAEISRVTAAIRRDTLNVVLIGMPSSGKSTIGRMLAEKLGKRFIDLDDEVVKADGRTIPEIFAAEGEDSFRRKETEQIARFAKEGRQLLSCGGGVIKRPENIRLLHQNGVILFLDRPLEALTVGGGRPLSSSTDALRAMYTERRPLYLAAADAVVPNHTTVTDAVNAAMEALDEIFDH